MRKYCELSRSVIAVNLIQLVYEDSLDYFVLRDHFVPVTLVVLRNGHKTSSENFVSHAVTLGGNLCLALDLRTFCNDLPKGVFTIHVLLLIINM